MAKLSYLDSARMGLMGERARLAYIDYIKLAGLEGCSLYFEQLFRGGFEFWPARLRRQYPGLSDWRGPVELKSALRSLVVANPAAPVFLANRSARLMQFGIRVLTERSRRILVTDLGWPGHRRIIAQQRQAAKNGITTVLLRNEILRLRATAADVINLIASQYEAMRCDGVLLPAVSHLGVRLPLDRILERLAEIRRPRFTVIDGAQALGHVPSELGLEHCDYFVAGCHKWLGSHIPLGVALCPSEISGQSVVSACRRMVVTGQLDDPLLHFVEQLEEEAVTSFGETVNVSALFAARAAISGGASSQAEVAAAFHNRCRNAERIATAIQGTGWRPATPRSEFRSGILLLRLTPSHKQVPTAIQLRELCQSHGLAITAYEGGLIRLAMPARLLSLSQLERVSAALKNVSRSRSKPKANELQPPSGKRRLKLRITRGNAAATLATQLQQSSEEIQENRNR